MQPYTNAKYYKLVLLLHYQYYYLEGRCFIRSKTDFIFKKSQAHFRKTLFCLNSCVKERFSSWWGIFYHLLPHNKQVASRMWSSCFPKLSMESNVREWSTLLKGKTGNHFLSRRIIVSMEGHCCPLCRRCRNKEFCFLLRTSGESSSATFPAFITNTRSESRMVLSLVETNTAAA